MASSAAAAFQARRKKLVDLALKKDPLVPPTKQVSFVHNPEPLHDNVGTLPEHATTVEELPPLNVQINAISGSDATVNELPPLESSMIRLTSAESIHNTSPTM